MSSTCRRVAIPWLGGADGTCEEYNTGPDEYLRHLEACKRELAVPVIGSLNGASEGGWIR